MRKSFLALCILCTSISFIFFSCDEKLELSKEIKNIVPDSTLTKIIELGMPIFKGSKPTNLVNYYLASPFILKESNIPADYTGKSFSDYSFHLYDQDNENLSIKLDYYNGGEEGSGLGGFISGNGDDFSVFIKVHSTYKGGQADLIHIISGTMTDGGIKDLYFANFMLNNYGNAGGVWIENEQGRIIYDSDGMSPIVQSIQTRAIGNKLSVSGAVAIN